MKKIPFIIWICSFFLLLVSCSEDKNVLNPSGSSGSPDSQSALYYQLKQSIDISMMNYDSLTIHEKDGFAVKENSITTIQFGDRTSGVFKPEQELTPVYLPSGSGYLMQYLFPVKIFDVFLRAKNFTMRFLLSDSGYIDVDTLALLYKYPYQSTQIFLKLPENIPYAVTGFKKLGSNIYFAGYGAGLIKYNLISKELRQWKNYSAYNLVTGNASFLFLADYEGGIQKHTRILRFNISADSADVLYEISSTDQFFIGGIECSNDSLFVLVDQFNLQDYLAILDVDGRLLEKIDLDRDAAYSQCFKYDHFLYFSEYYYSSNFLKYDLNTHTFSDGKLMPSRYISGMQAAGDTLLFLDDYREILATIPFAEIE
ncbi:MAG: hypothetical protein P8184_20540 [Calditrichia bacterium]